MQMNGVVFSAPAAGEVSDKKRDGLFRLSGRRTESRPGFSRRGWVWSGAAMPHRLLRIAAHKTPEGGCARLTQPPSGSRLCYEACASDAGITDT